MKNLSYKQYSQYFMIGGIVGVITVIIRHVVAVILPADTPKFYMLSIVVAYTCGIILSFILQKTFTFKKTRAPSTRWEKYTFIPFSLVAIFGSLLTLAFSVLLRYTLKFDLLFGAWSGTLAFISASILASIISYTLNAKIVFKQLAE